MWKGTVLKLSGNLSPHETGAVLPAWQECAELVCATHRAAGQDGQEVKGWRYCYRRVPSLFSTFRW